MNRNSLCFCGSGKKQKLCHDDIEPNSLFAELILLYKKIDLELLKSKNPSNCYKGCNNCCKDLFAVSSSEFIYAMWGARKKNLNINNILLEGEKNWEKFKGSYPEVAEKLEINTNSMNIDEYSRYLYELFVNITDKTMPCVFLSDDGSCSVYEYRPIICRYHGVGYIDDFKMLNNNVIFCSKNPGGVKINELIDLSNYADEIIKLSVFNIPKLNINICENVQLMFLFCRDFYRGYNDLNRKIRELTTFSKAHFAEMIYQRNIKHYK